MYRAYVYSCKRAFQVKPTIGSFAFYGCSSLVSISLPANLTSIGSRAFANCSSLAAISLPAALTSTSATAPSLVAPLSPPSPSPPPSPQ